MDYREDSPEILLDFLSYHETIKAHSQRTVDEYYLDLRNFFRYLKWTRDPALQEQPMESVDVRDVDLTFVGSVTLTEIYAYMSYLSRDRVLHPNSDRSAKGLKTILTAIEKIKSGISICIFPEGTRNKNKDELELLPFHEGSFKIASKSGCAIIPMAMNNTAEIFEAHMPKIKSTHVVLEYGKPIYVKELSKEDQKHLGTYTQNIIYEMLEKNKSLI